MGAVVGLLATDAWSRGLPDVAGPTVHLDLTLSHGHHTVTVRWHIVTGRPTPTDCEEHPCPSADLHGAMTVPALRVLDVFDDAVDDPLLAMLAPPADASLSFEGLLYIGGLIDTWVPALRRLRQPVDVAATRAELAGAP